MEGIVIDDNGNLVKAAIIKVTQSHSSDEENESGNVTYAETDGEGRFLLLDLDPESKYIIEIYVEKAEPKAEETESFTAEETEPFAAEETEPGDEEDELPEVEAGELPTGTVIIDSLAGNNMIDEITRENISICSLFSIGFNAKDKPYLAKTNLW